MTCVRLRLRRVFAFSLAQLREKWTALPPSLIHFDISSGSTKIKKIWVILLLFIFENKKSNALASYEEAILWVFLRVGCAWQ